MAKAKIIGGGANAIFARQKSDEKLEIGELLIAEEGEEKTLMQVSDVNFGSQLSQQHLELVAGLQLEEDPTLPLIDAKMRAYTLATLKPLLHITKTRISTARSIPKLLTDVRNAVSSDLSFITEPQKPLRLGLLRSGSSEMPIQISLPGEDTLSHHILISATTGKGKSNLTSCLLWRQLEQNYAGMLVLDPHDEYYGHNGLGLKDHQNANEKLRYYTCRELIPGALSLRIPITEITPWQLDGVMPWSDAQREAMHLIYRKNKSKWIESLLLENTQTNISEGTMSVLKRRIMNLLDIDTTNESIVCNGAFCREGGETTVTDIITALEDAKTVIIDTSELSGQTEILMGSILASKIFNKRRSEKEKGKLSQKPVVSIVIEEAPRVLGKDALEKGSNIFATIAREGRKFRVGLIAITQLPSLIPRDILANMNTKVIMGMEMKPERDALIASSAQDLSQDERAIASLEKGEAIVTSTFSKFALPIKIPLLKDIAVVQKQQKRLFAGVVQ